MMARLTGKGLDVDIEGDERLKRKLRGAVGALRNLKPPLQRTARDLRKRQRRVFQSQGAYQGTPWKSLSPFTMKAKRKGWGYYSGNSGAGTLRSSRGLMRSYTDPGHPRHVEEIGRQSMEWGSNHPTAHLHAQGPQSRGPAPSLPQRPLLAFRDSRERDKFFREPIADHVLDDLADGR